MLVVGLSASETAAVLDKAGRVAARVHVACLNSAQNTVLAGREADLRRVEALLPDGTFKSWVAGNIAFHCPLVEPILQDMHTQLSPFLPADPVQEAAPGEEGQTLDASQVLSMLRASGRASQEESDVTFISTVTGDVYEGPLSPAYWLRNVREAVQFQGAVETLLRLPDCPKYVLEVGPHKTLLAPLLQTAQAVGGDKGFTAALSTLKRGEADDAMFMHMLAKLFEAGMHTLSLDRWFRRDEDYELLRDMPGHPMIKTRLFKVRQSRATPADSRLTAWH
jgi:acyl transferase domain-containing protein